MWKMNSGCGDWQYRHANFAGNYTWKYSGGLKCLKLDQTGRD